LPASRRRHIVTRIADMGLAAIVKEYSMASQQGSNSSNQKQQEQASGSSGRAQQGGGQGGSKSGNQSGGQGQTRGGSSEQHAEAGRQSHKNSR
jgi:uncharacterized protein